MARDQRDHYYRMAKVEGYRARSAYKLMQMNEKFHLIKKGDSVVDLGAALAVAAGSPRAIGKRGEGCGSGPGGN
jgi:hypothetical protein